MLLSPSILHTSLLLSCQVCKAAQAALLKCGETAGNRDIEPAMKQILDAIARPSHVADCVNRLSGITFVQVSKMVTSGPSCAGMKPTSTWHVGSCTTVFADGCLEQKLAGHASANSESVKSVSDLQSPYVSPRHCHQGAKA